MLQRRLKQIKIMKELKEILNDVEKKWKINEKNPIPDFATSERELGLLEMARDDIKQLVYIVKKFT